MKTIEADVVVCGGGPAGVNAAIAAGRSGARTVLIERYGFIGGMSTAALVYPWMTFHTLQGKQVIKGIAQEIVDRLTAMNGSPGHLRDTVGFTNTITPYHPEMYKVLAVDMLKEADVKLLLHSMMHEAYTEGGRIESVRLATKSGKIDVKGKVFVDATGDADLANLAGAPCLQGREGDGLTQPMTMKFRMRGVDLVRVKRYMLEHPDEFYGKTPFDELERLPLSGVLGFFKHWKQADLPINRDQVLFFTGPESDEVLVNTTRVQGLNGLDVEDLTEAEELKMLQKLAKQRKDSLEIFRAQNREDLAKVEEEELAIIDQFLPQQLSEAELTAKVKEIIAATGATSPADMGKVMGAANKSLAGQADGKLIADAVKKLLAS